MQERAKMHGFELQLLPVPGPLRRGIPRPFTRNALPSEVPAGMRMRAPSPSMVGTVVLQPSAACG